MEIRQGVLLEGGGGITVVMRKGIRKVFYSVMQASKST